MRMLHGRGIGWLDAHLLASALLAGFRSGPPTGRWSTVAEGIGAYHVNGVK
ncbi:MAG: hypothetical protein R2712_03985 [Vicinamibacterales bacterium]